MALKDVRQCVDVWEKAGELRRIDKEVDWDCEMGAIARHASELGAPAPLFQNIKDYPGHRVMAGMLASMKRLGLSLGLAPEASTKEILDELYSRWERRMKPVVVDKAPCQENVVTGDDVDLTMFPVPMVHEGDGGRYISTWHGVVTKDLDTDWTNWGMYRQMLHDERLMGGYGFAQQDIGKIRAKYEAKGLKMPFATFIGMDPLTILACGSPVGVGIDEVDVAGGLRGEPVELVKCKTVDIRVPANAEIILEGHVLPGVAVDEGPFGEYSGYRAGPRMPRTVYRVEAITWRNDPILTMSCMGIPVDDGQIAWGLGKCMGLRRVLLGYRYPVTGVYVPPEGVGHIVIVATKTPYNHIGVQIANAVLGASPEGFLTSIVIVVDDSTDPYNLTEVWHALATKFHPVRGLTNYPCWSMHAFQSLQERMQGHGGVAIFDCTWPVEWDPYTEKMPKSSFREIYSEETQKKVLENWTKYGYK